MAQIQVLFPADDRGVRTHEGAEETAVGQTEGHSIELLFLGNILFRHIAEDAHLTKTAALGRSAEEREILQLRKSLLLVLTAQ